ncbi:hypothetical protein NESM_000157900 [Novymonas esmeraldas]|uniref:Trypanosoma Tc-38 (p38) protein domain-containing protein n=1 Tax=Novymonas esmeraldas TaxID=1808958 RepID=A0AAW0F460_9TRYP
MPVPPPRLRQQRLFTGALFPELLNDQLAAFAVRHGLNSDVWVPRNAIGTALKPYGVHLLPNATVCDISLSSISSSGDVTAALGTERAFVNAAHTSCQKMLESFREFMVACPVPPLPINTKVELEPRMASPASPCAVEPRRRYTRDHFSAADKAAPLPPPPPTTATQGVAAAAFDPSRDSVLLPDPSWDRMPPFQHPMDTNGSLITGTKSAARLAEMVQKRPGTCNYWQQLRGQHRYTWNYVRSSSGECSGRYNPYSCVRYNPHTYTGSTFPSLTNALMRHRAVIHGYVSRLWLTLQQAEELFGGSLLHSRAKDGPVVYCNHLSGGLEATAYYCADQFACGHGRAFPSLRDISLAVRGVWIDPAKTHAYPLLARLATTFKAADAEAAVVSDRVGTDLAMPDVSRHAAFFARQELCHAVRLHGFWTQRSHDSYLRLSGLTQPLQQQCLLCDYPLPWYISHRVLLSSGLSLRDGQQGIVQQKVPVPLDRQHGWLNGECWFNVAQLRESAVGQELVDNTPRHFLTRQRLHGSVGVSCCWAQLVRRRRESDSTVTATTTEWVPGHVLDLTGWQLRQGALGVPYVSLSSISVAKRFTSTGSILFNLADVRIRPAAARWLRTYTPVNERGQRFLRGARLAMALRAFERGYKSACWYAVKPTGEIVSSRSLSLRRQFKGVEGGLPRPLLDVPLFKVAPFVMLNRVAFVNAEEVTDGQTADATNGPEVPVTWENATERALAEYGIGTSAEAIFLGRDTGRIARKVADGIFAEDGGALLADADDIVSHRDVAVDEMCYDQDANPLPYIE